MVLFLNFSYNNIMSWILRCSYVYEGFNRDTDQLNVVCPVQLTEAMSKHFY